MLKLLGDHELGSTPSETFRLLDLPPEIRNKVYEFILCSFKPAPPSESLRKGLIQIQSGRIQELVSGICPAVHDIETGILCTSKQIHREAYDVMIKTNQFVHVQTADISMSQLLIDSQLPIVTLDRAHAEQFRGYVLRINMSPVPGSWIDETRSEDEIEDDEYAEDEDFVPYARPKAFGPQFSFMLLGRDWSALCRMLSEADIYVDGFSANVRIVLSLNPWPSTLPTYKAPITEIFTVKTQEALLNPFRSQIRGFAHVEIDGTVSPQLAAVVAQEVKKSPWNDPCKILKDLQEAEELGAQFYKDGKVTEASEHWTTAVSDVRRMRGSASWEALALEGGPSFIQKLAELQFTLLLNSAQNSLRVVKASPNNMRAVMTIGDVVISNLEEASGLPEDFSNDGSLWRPSDAQMAQLWFMQAQCWRLMGEIEYLDDALQWILMAEEMSPGDAEVEDERRAIVAWAESV